MPYIYYFVHFYDNEIQVIFDSKNKVNDMNPNYIQKLCLKIWKTRFEPKKLIVLP